MSQLTYQDQRDLPAFEGGLYDTYSGADMASYSPGGNVKQVDKLTIGTPTAAVAQVERLTVDTAADGDAFTITVGQYYITGTSSGTDAGDQRDAILALMNANEDLLEDFTVAAQGAASIDVTAKNAGTPFTVTETVEATSAYSWANQTPNTIGTQFKLTIEGYELLYGAGSTVAETERDALLALLQADSRFDDLVDFGEESTNILTITAKTAGVPFTASYENENGAGQAGTGTMTYSTTTANQTGDPVPFGRALAESTTQAVATLPSATGFTFLGVSIHRAHYRNKDNSVSPPVTGEAQWQGNEAMPVLKRGRIWVKPETAVAPGDQVHVRHTQGAAAAETVGRFRASADGGDTDQITAGARWVSEAQADELAVLELNLPQ